LNLASTLPVDTLGAAVGASCAAVHVGFAPNDYQVADYWLVVDLLKVLPELFGERDELQQN
jgi:electron transfer flavoprotein alpha subunit